ncbi:MAG: YARHG domain-containing protein [Lachnospiraceae bacterium]|nr:YARHG domain-containing protein [Lachnospiraceae bacterium]
MFCTKCGKQVPDGSKFCTACGNPMPGAGNQQSDGYQKNNTGPAVQGMPAYGGHPQQQKKGGKGPIIAVIVVAALVIIGLIVFFVLRGMNNTGQPASSAGGSAAAPGSKAPSQAGSGAGDTETLQILRDYFRNNLAAQYEEADKDYYMDYGGEYGEFRSADVDGGTVSAAYADIDNDGKPEMLVTFWDFDKFTGIGNTSVGVFKADGNLVKRLDNKEIRSVSYGGTNYTAQAAFKQKDGGIYIYLTTMFMFTTHEGGYFDPTIKVYEVKDGSVRLLCDTTSTLPGAALPMDFARSISSAKDYMPDVISAWEAKVKLGGQYDTPQIDYSQEASIPLFADLSKFDSDIKMLAVNYFMKTRNNVTTDIPAAYYYGYWETYTGDETRKEYQGIEHEVLTVPTGTKIAANKDYILEYSSTRPVTAAELEKLNAQELKLARNEIYARHGRKFKDKELQDYFNSKPWYRGTIEANKFNDNWLTEIEKKNRDLIQEYEKRFN